MVKADGHNEQWKTVKLGEYALIVRGGSPRPIDSYMKAKLKKSSQRTIRNC